MNNKLNHLAIIPDGSGRWAKLHNLPRYRGHIKGFQTALKIIDYCIERKIPTLTMFTLSSDNMHRKANEVKHILAIVARFCHHYSKSLNKKNIKLHIIGDFRELQKTHLVQAIYKVEQATQNNTGLNLNIAINYGGRQDILHAVKDIYKELQAGVLKERDLNEQVFSNHTYLKELPEVDLCIRTGAEVRISNFCLWQLAYAEFKFLDVLWPDFNATELDKALEDFAHRKRRFGLEAA